MRKLPKMKSCRFVLAYSADDGYRSEARYTSKRAGSPEACVVAVADEIARLAELFGCGDAVQDAVEDARQRVRDWKAANPEYAP